MNRWIVAALCSAVIAGCGASNNDGMIVAADSGTASGADTGASVDTGSSTDRGSATTDRGSATTDRGSATTDTGMASEFGRCGMATHTALCMCGNDQMCQQTALQNALGSNTACRTCYAAGITGCCPAENDAIQTCAQAAGCMDQACAQRMCAMQFNALQTCFNNGLMSNTMCQGLLQQCFGAEFPALACN
jgi:hypothetical protein